MSFNFQKSHWLKPLQRQVGVSLTGYIIKKDTYVSNDGNTYYDFTHNEYTFSRTQLFLISCYSTCKVFYILLQIKSPISKISYKCFISKVVFINVISKVFISIAVLSTDSMQVNICLCVCLYECAVMLVKLFCFKSLTSSSTFDLTLVQKISLAS